MTGPDGEAAAALLGQHYALQRIEVDELDRRLGLALTGDSAGALAGLDPLPQVIAPERRRWGGRHGESARPQPGWVPTRERFIDPSSQRVMRVWVDPSGQQRHYVPEET